jgi:3-deoxy-D-manno-octulosonic-acid transferase
LIGTRFMWLYNGLALGIGLLALPLVLPHVVLSPKRRASVAPRLGFGPIRDMERERRIGPRSGRPIWLHALSVGELLSSLPLLDAIDSRFPESRLVVSVSTRSGHDLALSRLRGRVDALLYFPYDTPFAVLRRIRRIRPAAVVIVETDLWPNFLYQLHRMAIPCLLVNARLSRRSFLGYKRLSAFMTPLLGGFRCIGCQSELDRERFESLGVDPARLAVSGNLKFDLGAGIGSQTAGREILNGLAGAPRRPVIVAGSTHPGEEALIWEALNRRPGRLSDSLVIVVPRDPNRAASIAWQAHQSGRQPVVSSMLRRETPPDANLNTVVVDEMGVLHDLYALADVAIVGGSFFSDGGHNPLEPAVWSKPVVFGRDMSDFLEIARLLVDGQGAVVAADADALSRHLASLLATPAAARAMGARARAVVDAHRGAAARCAQLLGACLQGAA